MKISTIIAQFFAALIALQVCAISSEVSALCTTGTGCPTTSASSHLWITNTGPGITSGNDIIFIGQRVHPLFSNIEMCVNGVIYQIRDTFTGGLAPVSIPSNVHFCAQGGNDQIVIVTNPPSAPLPCGTHGLAAPAYNGYTIGLYGQGGADVMGGSVGNDMICGGADNDEIIGHEGNDVLDGWTENDLLVGDAGLDQLFGYYGNDGLFEPMGAAGVYLWGESGEDCLRVWSSPSSATVIDCGGDTGDQSFNTGTNVYGCANVACSPEYWPR